MRTRLLATSLLLGVVALAGCQSSPRVSFPQAAPSASQGADEESVLPDLEDCEQTEVYEGWTTYCSDAGYSSPSTAPDEPASAAPNPRFGETFTYENGVAVTISVPQPYTPSSTAAVDDQASAAFIAFDITVTNGSSENYDPAMFSASLQSGSTESAQVFDSANDVGGTPTTSVLPGRDVVFRMAFGVIDPADMVMEFAPGYEYEEVLFTS